MVTLEELCLTLPHPSALGVHFFEALCAVPVKVFTGNSRREWTNWMQGNTKWQARTCPSLYKLQIQYARWRRKGEMDTVTPLLVAVARTRRNLNPWKQFDLKLGGYEQLHLVGMTHEDITFQEMWRGTLACVLSNPRLEELYLGSLRELISGFIGFPNRKSVFLLKELGDQYYGSFLNRLRAFHHHSPSRPRRSYNILPFFKHLEELYISDFYFEACPPGMNLPLCRTLRRLHISNTPLDWMEGQTFKQVVECRITVYTREDISKLSKVEMPACTSMVFAQSKYQNVLASFHLPSLHSLTYHE